MKLCNISNRFTDERERRIYEDEKIRERARQDYRKVKEEAASSLSPQAVANILYYGSILVFLALFALLNEQWKRITFLGLLGLIGVGLIFKMVAHIKRKNYAQMLINQKMEQDRLRRVAARKQIFLSSRFLGSFILLIF